MVKSIETAANSAAHRSRVTTLARAVYQSLYSRERVLVHLTVQYNCIIQYIT